MRNDTLSTCLKAGDDIQNLDSVLHPMFKKLKKELHHDEFKYKRFYQQRVSLYKRYMNTCVSKLHPFIYHIVTMTKISRFGIYRPSGKEDGKVDMFVVLVGAFCD